MEAREIMVANTRTQKRIKLTTGAETLGELKAALTAEGIDYNGMSFTEGISKTILLEDSTPLPRNITYKGNVTNNLIILLTDTTKNIKSGAEGTRQEAYEAIREYNLEDAVKRTFGRNFTLVSTSALWNLITDYEDDLDEQEGWEEDTEEEETPANKANSELVDALYKAVKAMVKAEVISYQEVFDLADLFTELAARTKEENNLTIKVGNTTITAEDVDQMMASLQ